MHITLRFLLIVFAVAANLVVIRRIRRARLRIEDGVFWVVFSFLILLLALFPEIIYFLSDLTGTRSPANLLYLIIIAILIVKLFFMSIQMSVLDTKLRRLAQEMALDKRRLEEQDRNAGQGLPSGSESDSEADG